MLPTTVEVQAGQPVPAQIDELDDFICRLLALSLQEAGLP